jgi:hypothetical protein
VEIKNEVATLFTPAGFSSSSASATYVHCEDLEIIDATTGSAPLTLKVLKRYGTSENLGQIKSCGERLKPEAAPVFLKGPNVFNAEYVKPGSPERRRLDVFESADGQNYYHACSAPGDTLFGDNVAISRHFMLVQLEYEAQEFRYRWEQAYAFHENETVNLLLSGASPFECVLLGRVLPAKLIDTT